MKNKDIERFGSIIEEDDEYEREGWKTIFWVLPAVIFISYLIARTVATFVWGV